MNFWGYTNACIGDPHHYFRALLLGAKCYFSSLGGELDRIGKQVGKHLVNSIGVNAGKRERCRRLNMETKFAVANVEKGHRLLKEGTQSGDFKTVALLTGLNSLQVEEIVNEICKPGRFTTWKVSRETKSHCSESSWHQGLQDLGTRGPARKEPLGEG